MKFDVTKPAFAYYISVKGMSRQRAEQHVSDIIENYNSEDVNMFFVPIGDHSGGDTRIECIYNPVINQTFFRP